ncbi:MAG TPA: hypothetical protein VKE40_06425 [Gemmataceae bacterium]|nr:hypothetical protein [Gemmataceae bacterium]
MSARSRSRRARAAIVWTIGWYVFLQIAVVVGMEVFRPLAFDREAMARRELLDARRAERPGSDLLIVVGSSRIGLGFLPGQLPPLCSPEGREVIVFNESHLSAGPRGNLVRVERLFRDGVTPRWLVLESIPGGMTHEGVPASQASFGDLPALCRHADRLKVLSIYGRERLNVISKHRQFLLGEIAPAFVTRGPESNVVRLEPLGDDRLWMRRDDLPAEKLDLLARMAEQTYRPRLAEWSVDPDLDTALRETLDLCREKGIPTVVVLTPESGRFRGWYSGETAKQVADYYTRLSRETGVPVVDARDWVADTGFNDPHHLNTQGARLFTARLDREVLRPLTGGWVVPRWESRASSSSSVPSSERAGGK